MDKMEDVNNRSSTLFNQNSGNDNNEVIILSSESSEDETVYNYTRRNKKIEYNAPVCENKASNRRLDTARNEITDLSQQFDKNDIIAAKVSSSSANVPSNFNNSTLQCNELLKGLHALMHNMEILEKKFQKKENTSKSKPEHPNNNVRCSNESSLTGGTGSYCKNRVKLNIQQDKKSFDDNSHSGSETSFFDFDSFKRDLKMRKRKYRHRSRCSDSYRKRLTSKRKRRKHCRNCIRCEEERLNCYTYTSVRENDMTIKIKKVAFNFNSSPVHQIDQQSSGSPIEVSSESSDDGNDDDNDNDDEDDDVNDSSSQYEQPNSVEKQSTKSKCIQGSFSVCIITK